MHVGITFRQNNCVWILNSWTSLWSDGIFSPGASSDHCCPHTRTIWTDVCVLCAFQRQQRWLSALISKMNAHKLNRCHHQSVIMILDLEQSPNNLALILDSSKVSLIVTTIIINISIWQCNTRGIIALCNHTGTRRDTDVNINVCACATMWENLQQCV